MGKRGPKPGFKARRAAEAAAAQAAGLAPPVEVVKKPRAVAKKLAPVAAAVAAIAEPLPDVVTDPALVPAMLYQHRENPEKLGGEALKRLAHQRGISRSEADRLDDDKLRQQLRIRAYHYAEAEA